MDLYDLRMNPYYAKLMRLFGLGNTNFARVLKLTLLAGLTGLSSCSDDLTPRTQVVGLRVLAIRADPPEVAPGQATSISVLAADPDGNARAIDWLLSLCTPNTSTGSCIELDEIAAQYPDPEDAQAALAKCCIRYGQETPETGVLDLPAKPSSTVITASSMLNGLDEPDAQEGVNAQLSLILCVTGACPTPDPTEATPSPDAENDTGATTLELPPDLSALAIKRVRVSTSESPNQNPEFEGVLVDDIETELEGEPVALKAGKTYVLRPTLAVASIEPYSYVLLDGTLDARCESPYFSWYSTFGDFERGSSEFSITSDCAIDPTGDDGSIELTLPPSGELLDQELTVYVVVYDRRGGLAWWYFQGWVE